VTLALDGGAPVRRQLLPYGRPLLDEDDRRSVLDVMQSDWLTTGPRVEAFEQALAATTGAGEAVAVSSGTAALHAAMHALAIRPGDEVVVPALTFVSTANCVRFMGGDVRFADICADTLLVDPESAAALVGPRTRAVVGVDFAGQPCNYAALREIAGGRPIVADACHSLGSPGVGTFADLTCFSFHPVKVVTTGEGGAVATGDGDLAHRMRVFRNHGIDKDTRRREQESTHHYAMMELGFNYRLSDMACALGIAQLKKLDGFVARRRALAARYDAAFGEMAVPQNNSAYHLYVVQLDLAALTVGRDRIFDALRAEGIGVQVHYMPVHLHPFYGGRRGQCPRAEAAHDRMLSLPLFPAMTDVDADDVIEAVNKVLTHFCR